MDLEASIQGVRRGEISCQNHLEKIEDENLLESWAGNANSELHNNKKNWSSGDSFRNEDVDISEQSHDSIKRSLEGAWTGKLRALLKSKRCTYALQNRLVEARRSGVLNRKSKSIRTLINHQHVFISKAKR